MCSLWNCTAQNQWVRVLCVCFSAGDSWFNKSKEMLHPCIAMETEQNFLTDTWRAFIGLHKRQPPHDHTQNGQGKLNESMYV